jgi:acetyltransferase-like isoleucine patch superfamily enzyme
VPDAFAHAMPRMSGRRTWQDRRLQKRVAHAFERATLPPPPGSWARFGRSFVVPPARISRPDLIEIGDDVTVLENVWMSVEQIFEDIRPRLVLGDRVRIGRGCQFTVVGEVVVEDDVLIGDFVQIGDTSHLYEARIRAGTAARPLPTRVCAGALVAGHAVLLPGVTVGAGAIVDHHSVVTADVPPGAVVSGNPARPVTDRR